MKTDDRELLHIINRARVELLYTRSTLTQFLKDNPRCPEIEQLMDKCSAAVREADALISTIQEALTPKPTLVKGSQK